MVARSNWAITRRARRFLYSPDGDFLYGPPRGRMGGVEDMYADMEKSLMDGANEETQD